MRKYAHGEYVDMTEEEIAELEAFQEQVPSPVPTSEERLDALEAAIKEGLQL